MPPLSGLWTASLDVRIRQLLLRGPGAAFRRPKDPTSTARLPIRGTFRRGGTVAKKRFPEPSRSSNCVRDEQRSVRRDRIPAGPAGHDWVFVYDRDIFQSCFLGFDVDAERIADTFFPSAQRWVVSVPLAHPLPARPLAGRKLKGSGRRRANASGRPAAANLGEHHWPKFIATSG